QAEDGIRDRNVTGIQTCALPISRSSYQNASEGYVEPIASKSPRAYDLLYNKYYVDEGYDYAFTGRRKLGDVRLGAMGLGEASSRSEERRVGKECRDRWGHEHVRG